MTDEMKSYDVPSEDSFYDPDSAKKVLDGIMTDAVIDKHHPYTEKRHPQNKAFREAVGKLHEVKAEGVSQEEAKYNQILEEGEKLKQRRIDQRVSEASKEMKRLVELGFTEENIPEDIDGKTLSLLKAQRLAAEGKFHEVIPILNRRSSRPELTKLVQAISETDLPDDMKFELTNKILFELKKEQK